MRFLLQGPMASPTIPGMFWKQSWDDTMTYELR